MELFLLRISIALIILIGIAHSYLGEHYIIRRLFRQTRLPELFGSDWFTRRTIRFAWHLTTLAWWGFAAILYFITDNMEKDNNALLVIIGVVFLIHALVALIFSRARHYSWIIFGVVAASCFYAV